jgi:peptide/nickel transport system substrate-binding protein
MSSFLATARSDDKRFDALLTGIPGDLSLAYLSSMYASSLSGSALDYGTFHSPALDSLLRAARAATPAVAAARWLAVQQLLDRAMPVAWVYHSRGVLGVRRRLTGVTMDLRGELVSVTRWRVDDGRRVAGSP